jgi:LysR family transcriptional regulator, regulator for bpeEF and oprC
MDKLRALQYFLVSAQEGSFSRAAQRLEVSVPAVAKLVNSLERELGATLFYRSAQGLTLTTGGERYRDACQPLLAQITAADDLASDEVSRVCGTLVVGAHPELVMMPWLAGFHERYPDIQIDLRTVGQTTIHETAAEVYVLHGWPHYPEMVLRRFAQPHLLTCAAPSYWAAHGIPRLPLDLERHICLLYRNDEGTVNDLWQYERGTEKVSVTVRGWLVSDHRNVTIHAALSGEGIVRISDLMVATHLHSGRLVPVLTDWQMADAPPFNLLYAPSQRRNPRARLFIDHVTEAFRELETQSGHDTRRRQFSDRPYWARGKYRRASVAVRRKERGVSARRESRT